VKRHFTKILAYALRQPLYREQIEAWKTNRSEAVAETVFEWFVDDKVKTAVKAWCLDVLAILASHHAWVRDELQPCVDALLPAASKGLLARIKRFKKD
jgi:hypothetical protein